MTDQKNLLLRKERIEMLRYLVKSLRMNLYENFLILKVILPVEVSDELGVVLEPEGLGVGLEPEGTGL